MKPTQVASLNNKSESINLHFKILLNSQYFTYFRRQIRCQKALNAATDDQSLRQIINSAQNITKRTRKRKIPQFTETAK